MPRRNEAIAERFGRNLRRARRQAGLGQERLAERASLHRTEIGQLELGRRSPGIETLVKLAGTLEVPVDQLLDGINWVPGNYRRGEFTLSAAFDSVALKRIGGDDG